MSCTNRDVQAVHAEALQAVLDRAAHAVRRVVEHDVVRRVGQRIDFRMPIVLGCLEQFPDFGGKQIVFAFLVCAGNVRSAARETEAYHGATSEIAYA